MLPPRLQQAIVVSVLAVWIANFAARFILNDYEPAPQIDAIFMAIAGGAIALNRRPPDEGDPK